MEGLQCSDAGSITLVPTPQHQEPQKVRHHASCAGKGFMSASLLQDDSFLFEKGMC